MADNKKIADGRDDSRVDSRDRAELEQVHSIFPSLTHTQVAHAPPPRFVSHETEYE